MRDDRRHQRRAGAQIEDILGIPEVDCAVDAVGFEAHGHGSRAGVEAPATVLNSLMDITRAAGRIGIPGLYVTGDPGRRTRPPSRDPCRYGSDSVGQVPHIRHGQCPVMRYHRSLMHAILNDRVQIAKAVTHRDHPRRGTEWLPGLRLRCAKKFVLTPTPESAEIGVPSFRR